MITSVRQDHEHAHDSLSARSHREGVEDFPSCLAGLETFFDNPE
jgi:hypothetical protein